MDQDQADRVEAMLQELLRRIGAGGAVSPAFVGPGPCVIDGAAINAAEPIASDWLVPMMSRELTRYGRIGNEPSNAPPGHPRRSPMGYPLQYPIAGDGTVAAGGPRVIYGESTFADDAAVDDWKRAAAARDAELARNGGRFSPHGPP